MKVKNLKMLEYLLRLIKKNGKTENVKFFKVC